MRPGDHWLGPAADNQPVTLTVLLKPPAGLGEKLLSGQYHPTSAQGAATEMAADPQDFAAVRQFAADNGLTIVSEDPATRRIVLQGTPQKMDKAFGIEIGQMRDAAGHTFRSYRGEMQLPPSLKDAVTAVLGIDQRPVARHAGERSQ